ncbi:hypothetical protein ACFV0O_01610 [Kitasatospora sp. NPDC059577]|uniref:hypothetical protein n=1 Tax=Kitasatospora sp. NPDC059577 TaxID=3346873 RepID=UPI0036A5474A
MPKREKPRTATVDGTDVVLLTPEQHAGLESARRQLGGAQAQVARMRLDLHRALQLLGEAERVLAGVPADRVGPASAGTNTDQDAGTDTGPDAGTHAAPATDPTARPDPGRGLPELLADIRAFLPPPAEPRRAPGRRPHERASGTTRDGGGVSPSGRRR